MFAGKFRYLGCLLAVSFVAAAVHAQQPPHGSIVLDPAHGGLDSGAHLSDTTLEKDANVALALRIRKLLGAEGFTVVFTREADTADGTAPTPDQRAEIANHAHALACLILHTTKAGHGVHLFTSALIPLTIADLPRPVLDWNTAQAASIPQSLRLVNELSASLNSARIPLVVGRTSIQPIDSLVCPAVAIELAPLLIDASNSTPADNEAYQQSVAEAVASALISWRKHTEDAAAAEATVSAEKPKSTYKPATKPTAKPAQATGVQP
jgi:N-acetylmuramoyl-L-alanine amidase